MVTTLKKIINKLSNKRRYNNYKKTNIFNQYNEKNSFGGGTNMLHTKWGRYSSCNKNCDIAYTQIGNYCQFAASVVIGLRNHIFTNFTINDFPYLYNEQIYNLCDGMFEGYFNKIGHDVWIGKDVIIVQGVEIGNGVIIASGSVITKSIPPYMIVGGNPAKVIKYRFPEEVIKKLENLHWYEWSLEDILNRRKELEDIVGFDIEDFKQKYWKTSKPFMKVKSIV